MEIKAIDSLMSGKCYIENRKQSDSPSGLVMLPEPVTSPGERREIMTIEEARKAAGLSRKEMSERFLIPYRTLQNWEKGLRQCPAWAERLIINELERMKEE